MHLEFCTCARGSEDKVLMNIYASVYQSDYKAKCLHVRSHPFGKIFINRGIYWQSRWARCGKDECKALFMVIIFVGFSSCSSPVKLSRG